MRGGGAVTLLCVNCSRLVVSLWRASGGGRPERRPSNGILLSVSSKLLAFGKRKADIKGFKKDPWLYFYTEKISYRHAS
jgi:hypothetical protein